MLEANKTCDHFATAIIAGQEVLCRFPILRQYCVSTARMYYVGTEDPPPESEVLKILKQFKQFKYCPKCGARLDFLSIPVEMKITDVKVKCPNCNWRGRVGLCNCDGDYPDVDYDDGRLRCPICSTVVDVEAGKNE